MATDKNRIQVYLSDNIYQSVKDYCDQHKLKSQSKAVEMILADYFGQKKTTNAEDDVITSILKRLEKIESLINSHGDSLNNNSIPSIAEEINLNSELLIDSLNDNPTSEKNNLNSESLNELPAIQESHLNSEPYSESSPTSPIGNLENHDRDQYNNPEYENEHLQQPEPEPKPEPKPTLDEPKEQPITAKECDQDDGKPKEHEETNTPTPVNDRVDRDQDEDELDHEKTEQKKHPHYMSRKQAYQLAKDDGYKGREAEFSNQLKNKPDKALHGIKFDPDVESWKGKNSEGNYYSPYYQE